MGTHGQWFILDQGKSWLRQIHTDEDACGPCENTRATVPLVSLRDSSHTILFFWSTGTDMQRSILGLLRSILCEILGALPILACAAFPHWQPRFAAVEPELAEVGAALGRVADATTTKLCLFIDGLDEFEGDEVDRTELTKVITEIVQRPHVKAVVSSRPLREFESAFQTWPRLAVHDFTMKDITVMVSDNLEADQYFCRLRDNDIVGARRLVKEIALRAEGVFLWAAWVVRILLDDCRHNDGMEELVDRLNQLPLELERLFSTMLARIPPRFRKEGKRYLQLAVSSAYSADHCEMILKPAILALGANYETSSANFWRDDLLEYTHEQTLRLSARLFTATQGLLEESHAPYPSLAIRDRTVEFMHATVVDFLEQQGANVWAQDLAGQEDADFDPDTALMLALGMHMRAGVEEAQWERSSRAFFYFVARVERRTKTDQSAFVYKVYERLAAHPDWLFGGDGFFCDALKWVECSHQECVFQDRNSWFLRLKRDLIFDILSEFGQVAWFVTGLSLERLDRLLESCDNMLGKARMPTHVKAHLGIDNLSTVNDFPWEMAMLIIYHRCITDHAVSDRCSAMKNIDLNLFEALRLLVHHTKTLTASCVIAEDARSILERWGATDCSWSGIMRHILNAECRLGPHEEQDAVSGRTLPILTCSCEEATGSRRQIYAVLKKLEDREKGLNAPTVDESEEAD